MRLTRGYVVKIMAKSNQTRRNDPQHKSSKILKTRNKNVRAISIYAKTIKACQHLPDRVL